ncbi:hypothetical protein ACIRD8_28200 [Streptomyces sp. NPDC102451]|uniref:hypothetical protein n=1 Tax=Streptomyces sp. NPDC102451 TaxID=3366177 RepID=UPI0038287946
MVFVQEPALGFCVVRGLLLLVEREEYLHRFSTNVENLAAGKGSTVVVSGPVARVNRIIPFGHGPSMGVVPGRARSPGTRRTPPGLTGKLGGISVNGPGCLPQEPAAADERDRGDAA